MGMPKKGDIFEYWIDWLIENGFDLGEPSCWACGWWWGTKYDNKNPDAPLTEIKKIWNEVKPLQRCHIIPKSLGGNDETSNLFLMCRECHDRAPNTISRETFIRWAKAQNWAKRRAIEIKEELKAFDINEENEVEDFTDILRSPEFKKWSKNKMGIHMSQAGYGPKLTISTLIAAVIEYKNNSNNTNVLLEY